MHHLECKVDSRLQVLETTHAEFKHAFMVLGVSYKSVASVCSCLLFTLWYSLSASSRILRQVQWLQQLPDRGPDMTDFTFPQAEAWDRPCNQ